MVQLSQLRSCFIFKHRDHSKHHPFPKQITLLLEHQQLTYPNYINHSLLCLHSTPFHTKVSGDKQSHVLPPHKFVLIRSYPFRYTKLLYQPYINLNHHSIHLNHNIRVFVPYSRNKCNNNVH